MVLGQRGWIFALTAIAMLIAGAVLGVPGQFPTVGETTFTPEFIFSLFGGLVAPLGLLVKSFLELTKALSARVNNTEDKFKANSLFDLLKAKEFWVYAVSAGVGIAQIFGVKVMGEEEQIVVANGLMAMASYLLQSWGDRPSGTVQQVVAIGEIVHKPAETRD